jgi:hypothetical protein
MVGILGALPVGYVVWFGSDSVLPAALRSWLHTTAGWNLDDLVPAFSNLDRFPFWMGFGILFGLGWIAILAVTLLTPPEPMTKLKSFYLAARPIGWWAPVRRALEGSGETVAPTAIRVQMLACCWGIVFYFSLTVGFFSLLGRRWSSLLAAGPSAALSGWMFLQSALRKRL